jgi:RND family efflux transporter MFP subunit
MYGSNLSEQSSMTKKCKVVTVFLAIFALLLVSCKKKETEATLTGQVSAVPVNVLKVQPSPLAVTITITGNLVSRTWVEVKAETTGRLVRFPKQEGDPVSAGETVAWVETENYELALRQAQTAVQVAEAGLERARVIQEHNQSELERSQNLLKSGGITEKELRATEAAQRDSQAQTQLAQAQLDQARAALGVAQKRLRDTSILAPVGGVIEKKTVNAGAYVEPPTVILTIVDNQQLELESPVPSASLGQVRSGQKVTFQVNSYPETTFPGQVIEVNPAVDPLSRAARVRIRVDNSSGKLKAGMFAEGSIQTGIAQEAIVIPAAAVYRNQGDAKDSYAFVVEIDKAVQRKLRIGREIDSKVEIVEGLKPGDLVVSEQKIELADGVRVTVGK